MTRPKINF